VTGWHSELALPACGTLPKKAEIQAEMRLRFTGVETGLAAIEHRLVAFHLTDVARADEITDLRRRIEKIERRLDLVDSA
jgi:hypothetical protein